MQSYVLLNLPKYRVHGIFMRTRPFNKKERGSLDPLLHT